MSFLLDGLAWKSTLIQITSCQRIKLSITWFRCREITKYQRLSFDWRPAKRTLFTRWARFPLFWQGIKFNITRSLIVTGEGGAETIADNNSKTIQYLLYRQECFTGKYTARKIHTKLHPGPEWRIFHILTSEDIDDVISRSFTAVRCKQSVKNGER